nr:(Fe-S)-binding protein [Candidatus Sigynarchaeum springense]
MPFIKENCTLCGDCFTRCQYLHLSLDDAKTEIKNLMEGRDSVVLSECATCYACNEYCKQNANPFDLIASLQEKRNSLHLTDAARQMLEKQYEPYESSKEVRVTKPFMSQCAFIKSHASLFEGKLFDGLDKLGGRNFFCNLLYFHTGQYSLVEKRAKTIVDNIAKLGVSEVICFHDECYALYKRYAPQFGVSVPFKPVHVFEYMVKFFKEHAADIKPLNLKVAYQRSCSSRLTPEKDKYLDELFTLLGVERVKREYDHENALCCQAAALQISGAIDAEKVPKEKLKEKKKLARDAQQRNIADAVKAGARAMVFVCPMCMETLENQCWKSNLVPMFVTDLGRMALGEIGLPKPS